ncbi:MAG: hypothetical protein NTV88_03110 [Candidatus Micrarchaeota archaeon]|nr:hypothetical protein [Candidatus Micrarchaeota archaeon]
MKQFLLIALVAAMLLLGCAGSSAPPANQQPAAQNNQPSANGQQPPAGSNQQPAAQNNNAPPAPPANSGGSDSDSFLSILGLKSTLQYKVAYDISSGTAGQQAVLQMTQYLKGTTKMRSDSAYQGIESRTYVVDGAYYSCSNAQGAWTCMKLTIPKEDTTKSIDDVATNKENYQITADGTMQVAGVTANCYKVIGKNLDYSRSCYSPEGVPLYVKITSTSAQGETGSTEMTATSYSTSVSDSDFALPAVATELPTAPPGAPGAGGDVCSYCSYMTGQDKTDCLASCAG